MEQTKDRFCIRRIGSNEFLASLCIIGDKMACAFSENGEEALNVTERKVANTLSDLCNAGGHRTYPYPWKLKDI